MKNGLLSINLRTIELFERELIISFASGDELSHIGWVTFNLRSDKKGLNVPFSVTRVELDKPILGLMSSATPNSDFLTHFHLCLAMYYLSILVQFTTQQIILSLKKKTDI